MEPKTFGISLVRLQQNYIGTEILLLCIEGLVTISLATCLFLQSPLYDSVDHVSCRIEAFIVEQH